MSSNFKVLFTSYEIGRMINKEAEALGKKVDTSALVAKFFKKKKPKKARTYNELKLELRKLVKEN